MSVGTFFGHRDCYGLDAAVLRNAIENLINQGVDTFYVGHQGHFDRMALGCLEELKYTYTDIIYAVVFAYLPTHKPEYDWYHGCSMYPEGIEEGPQRFAIERRNKWMIAASDYCLCYIDHNWGGGFKFARIAKKSGLQIVNLGSTEL